MKQMEINGIIRQRPSIFFRNTGGRKREILVWQKNIQKQKRSVHDKKVTGHLKKTQKK